MANVNARRFLPLLLALVQIAPAAAAWAACTVERAVSGEPALFVRHFSQDCTKAERAAQAVPAREILEALKAGKGVSIRNGVVSGDLLLTGLPAAPLVSDPLPPSVLPTMGGTPGAQGRGIARPFLGSHAIFHGRLG